MKKFLLALIVVSLAFAVYAKGGKERPEPTSDEQIQLQAVENIAWDTRLDGSDIEVSVNNGVVTLEGEVPTYSARAAAMDNVYMISGVRQVNNNLSIIAPDLGPLGELPAVVTTEMPPDDSSIEKAARLSLKWNNDLNAKEINVDSQDGLVTLTGTVDMIWMRAEAQEVVSRIVGISEISNKLVVVPTEVVEDEFIANNIIDAVDRNREVDVNDVVVEVDDGMVTLKGKVPAFRQKEQVYNMAAYTYGVKEIDNQLIVEG